MPLKKEQTERLYYSISEVAEKFNVNTSLIRFWEKEFNILKPAKNKKGNRMFTPEDVENIRLIYHLVKEQGFTLQGAKDKIKNIRSENPDNEQLMLTLQSIRNFLLEIKNQL